jgi:hypothetical protein
MNVLVYYQNKNKRSQAVTRALTVGIGVLHQDMVTIRDEAEYVKPEKTDCVAFYGLNGAQRFGNLKRILDEYRQVGTPTVFFDLGYFGRKGDPHPDFHRVAINGYQPTAYFQNDKRPPGRFELFNRPIQPWRTTGEEILVAGMSDRAARVWGLGDATEHAASMIAEVRKYTDRPITYRPKPSWGGAVPIPGTRFSNGTLDLQKDLARAWAVVTYRSNVAIDALIAGVPCFVLGDNPACVMSHNDLSRIEDPLRLSDPARLQFCADLAYCQFSLRELRSGQAWKEIRKQMMELLCPSPMTP